MGDQIKMDFRRLQVSELPSLFALYKQLDADNQEYSLGQSKKKFGRKLKEMIISKTLAPWIIIRLCQPVVLFSYQI